MRQSIIPILLLAAVALSTGVVLPRLKPLQPGPDPISDQSSDPHSTLTECEVLRKLYHMTKDDPLMNWDLDYDDNNQENYNEYINKRRGGWDQEHAFDDTWLSYGRQINSKGHDRNYFHQANPHNNDEATEPIYEIPVSDIEVLYARNKNILIRDNDAYYMYDTYVATTSPFDHVENKHNCLYQALSRPPHDETATDTENHETQADREIADMNKIPAVTQVVGKRYDAPDAGEKEIPDNLVFNDGANNEVQKKLFSFWSRLQALSHKGRQLPTRRHTFVYFGPDGTRDGTLTAETRASHLRPPGQPLRWG